MVHPKCRGPSAVLPILPRPLQSAQATEPGTSGSRGRQHMAPQSSSYRSWLRGRGGPRAHSHPHSPGVLSLHPLLPSTVSPFFLLPVPGKSRPFLCGSWSSSWPWVQSRGNPNNSASSPQPPARAIWGPGRWRLGRPVPHVGDQSRGHVMPPPASSPSALPGNRPG